MEFMFRPPSIAAALAVIAKNKPENQEPGVYMAFTVSPATCKNILAWAKRAGLSKRINDPKTFHVTTVYSREPFEFDVLGKCSTKARFMGFDVFGDTSASTLVATIASPFLQKLFQTRKAAGATYDFPSYKPHISLGKDFSKDEIDSLPPMTFPCLLTEEYYEPLDLDKDAKDAGKPDTEEKVGEKAALRVHAYLMKHVIARNANREAHLPTRQRYRDRHV